jgi:uncharacterized phage protein (TIGR02220 family)
MTKKEKKIISFFPEHWEVLKNFTDSQKGQVLTFIFTGDLPNDKEALITCKYIQLQTNRIETYKRQQADIRKAAWDKKKRCEQNQVVTNQTYIGATKVGIGRYSPTPSPNPSPSPNPKKDIYAPQAEQVLLFLNEATGRNFRPIGNNIKLIRARLMSGVSVEDCNNVIAYKYNEWHKDVKMAEFLRPATLFNATNFEQYLPAAQAWIGGNHAKM